MPLFDEKSRSIVPAVAVLAVAVATIIHFVQKAEWLPPLISLGVNLFGDPTSVASSKHRAIARANCFVVRAMSSPHTVALRADLPHVWSHSQPTINLRIREPS